MGKLQKSKLYLLIASLQAVMAAFLVLAVGAPATVSAAVGINSQLSFEGKIVKADGTNIANGTYNMEFKIYQDGTNTGTGSSLKWTEDRLVGGTGGVTLTDGTFQVNLGSVNPFGSSVDWNQDTLWLSMQIGNSTSCTITTTFQSNCSGDGEMTPYIRLTAVPYAQNANTLQGLSAAGFIQNSTSLQSSANFNISGTGTATTLQTATLDAQSGATALNIGSTNTTKINLNKQTVQSLSWNGTSSYIGNSQTITLGGGPGPYGYEGTDITVTDNSTNSGGLSVGEAITVNGSNANASDKYGIKVSVTGSTTDATSKSTGVYGAASALSGSIAYGGYFTLGSSAATVGASLYATNGTSSANILQLQDNTTDVMKVANDGATTLSSINASTGNAVDVLTVTGGTGAGTATAGNGSNISLTAGNGGNGATANGNGGNITISAGAAGTGAGTGGTAGSVIVKNQSNSTTAFQVQNASGSKVLNVDTVNNNLSVQSLYDTRPVTGELMTSSTTFGAAAGWTSISGTGQTATATHSSGGGTTPLTPSPAISISSGQFGVVTFSVTNSPTGYVDVSFGGYDCGNFGGGPYTNQKCSGNTTSSATLAFTPSNDYTGIINNVSFKVYTALASATLTVKNSDGTAAVEIRTGGTGNSNTFIGVNSGQSNTTGSSNTSLGYSTLKNTTIGQQNTAVGSYGLQNVTSGNSNTALGNGTLMSVTTGSYNTAVGSGALQSATGFGNTSVGEISGGALLSGNYNTASGYNSLGNVSTGNYNSALGYSAGSTDPNASQFVTTSSVQNATMVGYGAEAQASNVLILGGVGTTASSLMPNIGIGTTAPTNLFSISPDIYDTGTASVTSGSNAVTGTSTLWQTTGGQKPAAGMEFMFGDGTKYIIQSVNSDTSISLTTNATATESGKQYRIHNPAFYVKATGGTSIRTSTNSTTAFQVQDASNSNVLAVDSTNKHLKVYGANGTDYADIYYDSSTSTAYYGASTGTAVLGSGNGPVNVTAGSGAAANITGNAASTWQTTAGLLTVQGGAGILLSSQGANTGTTIKSSSNSVNAFQVQNATSVTGMAFDTSNFHLQIYDPSNAAKYVSIYYDDATSTAIIGASSGTVQVGGNTGPVTISTTGSDPVNITSATVTTTTGNFTQTNNNTGVNIQNSSAPSGSTTWFNITSTAALGTGGAQMTGSNISLTNTGTVGGILAGQQISVQDNGSTVGNSIYGIKSTANAGGNSSAATYAGYFSLGGSGSASSSAIYATNGSSGKNIMQLQSNTSDVMLVKPSAIQIGSATTDTTQVLFALDSFNTYADTATCGASTNQGSLYYNTQSNSVRGCIDGNWEDLISSDVIGLQQFGVVPDSGSGGNAGDIAGVTALTAGPCKVSEGATTSTVSWTGCTAFSGGRKVIVAAGTATTSAGTSATIIWQHLCLTGTNNQPALSAVNTEAANLATVSFTAVNSPILCLADIKVTNGSAVITGIYNTSTYTTTQKEFVTSITTAPVLGQIVARGTVTPGSVVATSAANAGSLAGVVVATTGATSTNSINTIIATSGLGWVKAITETGNAIGNTVQSSATAGYGGAFSAPTTTAVYSVLGLARTAWTSACAINSLGCNSSVLTTIAPR